MTLTEEIVESLCWSFSRAVRRAVPFAHIRTKNLFPSAVARALARISVLSQPPAQGKRESVKTRFYVDHNRAMDNSLLGAVASAFQSRQIVAALCGLCGASLTGTFLRLEYAVDTDGFWLEPHTDLGVKKFTGLIPLADDGEACQDLGTDLYHSPDTYVLRLPFIANSGTLFVPSLSTWHGFEARPIQGLRKSLIVNYVGQEWQSREQLAFPDRPISL